ncbi:probable xyloglucan endotransglucosylase/hydrolase protein 23 [Zingiber officinale]|uniref:Xyloglucan endotransglucosylase/hydrolase n=1 Tax=Zingiber officinale TaxID=94328 RepID=A0A8J5L1D5_ZINOF|nr:probable xyloglucan endotransglucosylase/hydrolase protein 23 [Zingiber officinale]KAG6501057.1 hypothetical protein ZIOFF_040924 [Zingiber officinale]
MASSALIRIISLATCSVVLVVAAAGSGGNFYEDVDITWGDGRGQILRHGRLITLSLDKYSGSGFQSKNYYLFGRMDMQIRLISGDSAGTVTTFYLSSDTQNTEQTSTHDEIDFEFLGNASGSPYTLQTNIYTQGMGNREMQFELWFDPTKHFHTYSILWNPKHIIFLVDGTPIRDFRNMESKGVAFPDQKPMRVYSTLWDGEDWATMGGRVKTDWSKAPFVASYRNFTVDACVVVDDADSHSGCNSSNFGWWNQELDSESWRKMRRVQRGHMIYNYCDDASRFPQGLPPEC